MPRRECQYEMRECQYRKARFVHGKLVLRIERMRNFENIISPRNFENLKGWFLCLLIMIFKLNNILKNI